MADPYNTQGLAQSLPVEDQDKYDTGSAAPAISAPQGWSARTAYDYNAFSGAQETTGFDGNARIYEFTDEHGDIGPAFPDLEIDLFGRPEDRELNVGMHFDTLKNIEVIQESVKRIDRIDSFQTAGLHPAMLENIRLCGWEAPTPIQKYTIPSIVQGHDVIGVAQTGSGKTAAYLIPVLSKLMGKARKLTAPRPNPATYRPGLDPVVAAEPLIAVIAPTRELAVQIFNEARKLCYRSMLRPSVVYGGMPIRQQMQHLTMGCDILIGTPGRMADFLRRPEILTFRRLRHMIIDEADTMLAEDEDCVRQILTGGEQDEGSIRYALFSATFPRAARSIAEDFLSSDHVHFHVGRAGSTTENIQQRVFQTDRAGKRNLLIEQLSGLPGRRTIIFVNSRSEADNLDDYLYNLGMPVVSIHSDRTQIEREDALRRFRKGSCPILVATGVTARGIDVRNVEHIINYDLPSMDHGGIEEYTHRIGRTGRIGHRGIATSFYTERDEPIASILTRTLCETKQEIPDFLQPYLPDMSRGLHFEDEDDFENGGADAGWAANATDGQTAAPANGHGWDSGDAGQDTAAQHASWGSNGAGAKSPADQSSGWGANGTTEDHGAGQIASWDNGQHVAGPPPADTWGGSNVPGGHSWGNQATVPKAQEPQHWAPAPDAAW